jgi:hypothetical protein
MRDNEAAQNEKNWDAKAPIFKANLETMREVAEKFGDVVAFIGMKQHHAQSGQAA